MRWQNGAQNGAKKKTLKPDRVAKTPPHLDRTVSFRTKPKNPPRPPLFRNKKQNTQTRSSSQKPNSSVFSTCFGHSEVGLLASCSEKQRKIPCFQGFECDGKTAVKTAQKKKTLKPDRVAKNPPHLVRSSASSNTQTRSCSKKPFSSSFST